MSLAEQRCNMSSGYLYFIQKTVRSKTSVTLSVFARFSNRFNFAGVGVSSSTASALYINPATDACHFQSTTFDWLGKIMTKIWLLGLFLLVELYVDATTYEGIRSCVCFAPTSDYLSIALISRTIGHCGQSVGLLVSRRWRPSPASPLSTQPIDCAECWGSSWQLWARSPENSVTRYTCEVFLFREICSISIWDEL